MSTSPEQNTNSESPQAAILAALWFAQQAADGSFIAHEALLDALFAYIETSNTRPFAQHLVKLGLLTPFQADALAKKLPPSPPTLSLHTLAEKSPPPSTQQIDRYQREEVIQQGGSGRIYRAYDAVIGRPVAIKCLLDPEDEQARKRFQNEYRITGMLEHPNIISLHDANEHPELGPFYVMRLLEGKTLREVLYHAHREGTPSRTSLLRTFLEICAAVAYSHSHGILHRDLKPSNIMVGDLGEAQVMDWGIARQMIEDNLPTPSMTSPLTEIAQEILGTPGYMAPEQLTLPSLADERADVFSLGCILYELLTGSLPYKGDQPETYLRSLKETNPLSPGQLDPSIGPELEEIVARTLEIDPQKRTSSVRELSTALHLYLEGTKTRKLREQRALSKVVEGIHAHTQLERKEKQAQEVLGELRGAQTQIRPYEPVERKRSLWQKEDQVEALQKEAMVWLGEATSALTQALALDPKSQEARRQLADLYHRRWLAAEARRDATQMVYNESMLRRYNDGHYDPFLKGEGAVTLLSDPPGARITLHPLEERERRRVPAQGSSPGEAPLGPLSLPIGSYIARLSLPGYRETIVPIFVQQDRRHIVRARLYREDDIPNGFCYVPQGRFLMGGDPLTASAGRTERPFVDDLFVATFPVTMREYLQFLNAHKPRKNAQPHAPRRSPDGGYYLQLGDNTRWDIPEIDEEGDSWDLDFPVLAISWIDAKAYADWKAKDTGLPLRLPLAHELEKAARGVDGRYYPWGDHFDATFCKMGKSQPGPPKPEVVGAYEADESVYLVRDLAGGIREWCGDVLEPADSAYAFGGNWSGSELTSRAAHRWFLQKGQVAPGIGMRIVMDAPQHNYHKGFDLPPSLPTRSLNLPTPTTPPHKPTPQLHNSSPIRELLSDSSLWAALADSQDEYVLTQLAHTATSQGAPWAMIATPSEELPLATSGDSPDRLPSLSTPHTFYECGDKEKPHGYLVLPEGHTLHETERDPLCAAIALILHRRREQQQAQLREKQALEAAQSARHKLTIVKEAFATLAPETYLNKTYPLLDGRSPAMRKLYRMLDRITQSQVNILIRGESGVGKERVALTIHQNGPQPDGPFVAVNCGAIPENLIESELFGYVKGAFTGAERDQDGLFQRAHGGTLFLDEIAELPLDAQVKLLRALQNRAVRPIGGHSEHPFQARILAATHSDLKQLVEQGHFREDLYWRLVVIEVEIPPLRKRPEDLPLLISRFLNEANQHTEIQEDAMELLQAHDWPGNVRELQNEIHRALVVSEGPITPSSLSRKLRDKHTHEKKTPHGTLKEIVAQVEQQAIELALQQSQGNKAEAARILGLSKRGLQLKLKRFGL